MTATNPSLLFATTIAESSRKAEVTITSSAATKISEELTNAVSLVLLNAQTCSKQLKHTQLTTTDIERAFKLLALNKINETISVDLTRNELVNLPGEVFGDSQPEQSNETFNVWTIDAEPTVHSQWIEDTSPEYETCYRQLCKGIVSENVKFRALSLKYLRENSRMSVLQTKLLRFVTLTWLHCENSKAKILEAVRCLVRNPINGFYCSEKESKILLLLFIVECFEKPMNSHDDEDLLTSTVVLMVKTWPSLVPVAFQLIRRMCEQFARFECPRNVAVVIHELGFVDLFWSNVESLIDGNTDFNSDLNADLNSDFNRIDWKCLEVNPNEKYDRFLETLKISAMYVYRNHEFDTFFHQFITSYVSDLTPFFPVKCPVRHGTSIEGTEDDVDDDVIKETVETNDIKSDKYFRIVIKSQPVPLKRKTYFENGFGKTNIRRDRIKIVINGISNENGDTITDDRLDIANGERFRDYDSSMANIFFGVTDNGKLFEQNDDFLEPLLGFKTESRQTRLVVGRVKPLRFSTRPVPIRHVQCSSHHLHMVL